MSEDRRYIAFSSSASNLVADGQDTNQRGDIFVFDRWTATMRKITAGSQSSSNPAISPSGRYVAFRSPAPDLVPGDTNDRTDVFLFDMADGSTKRVSVNSQGLQSNGNSGSPSVSSDGQVVFTSSATNLVLSDGNSFDDIFLHRTSTGVTTRISTSASGGPPNNSSGEPRITSNGLFVTYYSAASNLVPTDPNGRNDIFVWEANSGTTALVSIPNGGGHANSDSYTPATSEDGRFVAFGSLAGNLVSADGNAYFDVFVRDRVAGVTTRVSVSTNGTSPNSDSGGRTTISHDGRYVAFSSGASNLVTGDTNMMSDVFVRDLQEGVTTRVSLTSAGEQIADTSSDQMLSSDGRYVLFTTSARLVGEDQNIESDVYLYDRLGGPTVGGPPQAPTNFRVIDQNISSLVLAWGDEAFNETSYELERLTADGTQVQATWSLSPGTTVFSDEGVEPATLYRYRLRAVNDAGSSEPREARGVTANDYTPYVSAMADAVANSCNSLSSDGSFLPFQNCVYEQMETYQVSVAYVTTCLYQVPGNILLTCQRFILAVPANPPQLPDEEDPSVPPPGSPGSEWVPPNRPGEPEWAWGGTEGQFPTREGSWYRLCPPGSARNKEILHWDSPHPGDIDDHWGYTDCDNNKWERYFDLLKYPNEWIEYVPR